LGGMRSDAYRQQRRGEEDGELVHARLFQCIPCDCYIMCDVMDVTI
jgi:hypothetical protein